MRSVPGAGRAVHGDPWPSASLSYEDEARYRDGRRGLLWRGAHAASTQQPVRPPAAIELSLRRGKAAAVGHYYGPPLIGLQTEWYPAGPARQG